MFGIFSNQHAQVSFTNKIEKLSEVFAELNVQELDYQFISSSLPQS